VDRGATAGDGTTIDDGPPAADGSGTGGRRILGLDPNVVVAGLVSFFMDVSSEMIYPLVPLFLASVLGVNKATIGLIEGVAETTASILKLGSGWLSDRLGRRKLLMGLGYGISAASRPFLAVATSWEQVLFARFTDRFGKGVRTAPRDAIVADSSAPSALGRSFGFHRAMDQFGAVVGPAVAFLLLWARPGAYREVFWISMVPAVIAVLLVVFFIHERRRPRAATAPPRSGTGSEGLGLRQRLHRLRGPLLAYVLITGLFSLGNSSDAFLILRAQNLGVTATLIPLLYNVFNLVYSGLSIPMGLLADRVGRRRVMVGGYLFFAGVYAGMALAGRAGTVWALFALYGVYMGISDGNGRALLAELSPGDKRATAFGVYHAVIGMAALPASIIAGVLWDRVSPAAPFWLGAAGALLAAVLLTVFVPEPRAAA